jgi:hypothetical protein
MEESADDITAADTAPKPKKDTHSGVRYCRTNGRMSDALLGISEALKLSLVTNAVRFQSGTTERKIHCVLLVIINQ